MGFRRTGYGDKYKALGYSEYVCDTEADVQNLPTNTKEAVSDGCTYPKCAIGSTASVVASHKLYILNTAGEWKELMSYASGGSSGGGGGDDSGGGSGDFDLNDVGVYVADYATEPPEVIIGHLNTVYGYINGR